MKTYCFTLKIESAFGTPLVGDTLFGQLCWAIAHQYGENRLNQLLDGYQEQQPFAVVSDAFPHSYLPLPTLPSSFWEKEEGADRKKLKKKQWVHLDDMGQQAVRSWQKFAKAEAELMQKLVKNQPHNTLNRQTNTTGLGEFAPYSTSQIWYQPQTLLDLYIVFDENRITFEELKTLLETIGKFGFGRDASIGLGKFSIEQSQETLFPARNNANAYLALANCAPQQLGLDRERCFYQITTRFGRHGDIKALSQNPFKKPIILTKAGAVFTPVEWQERRFLGNGLGNISYAQPNAVHQGYAPVVPVAIEFDK